MGLPGAGNRGDRRRGNFVGFPSYCAGSKSNHPAIAIAQLVIRPWLHRGKCAAVSPRTGKKLIFAGHTAPPGNRLTRSLVMERRQRPPSPALQVLPSRGAGLGPPAGPPLGRAILAAMGQFHGRAGKQIGLPYRLETARLKWVDRPGNRPQGAGRLSI